MKLYCRVETLKDSEGNTSREVREGPMTLPRNSAYISNLDIMSAVELKEFGWLAYEKISENKEVFVSSRLEILDDKVIEFVETRGKTVEEKAHEKAQNEQQLWNVIRLKRDQLLLASDKLVVADRWEKMSSSEKEKIASYRQTLRDLPEKTSDPSVVSFPTL